jgi:hypothetical protein
MKNRWREELSVTLGGSALLEMEVHLANVDGENVRAPQSDGTAL